jgi:hypothetical protein
VAELVKLILLQIKFKVGSSSKAVASVVGTHYESSSDSSIYKILPETKAAEAS